LVKINKYSLIIIKSRTKMEWNVFIRRRTW